MIFRFLLGNPFAACTVHEPPDPPADRLDRAEDLVFIRDGFSWTAALFTPIWLLANLLWLPLLGYVAAIVVLTLLFAALGMPAEATAIAVLAVHLWFGFEADALRRWSLDNSGWQTLGSVTGTDIADCERRFFETWLPTQPIIRMSHGGSGLVAPSPVPMPPPTRTVVKPHGWRNLFQPKKT